jgi:hypothetical protein
LYGVPIAKKSTSMVSQPIIPRNQAIDIPIVGTLARKAMTRSMRFSGQRKNKARLQLRENPKTIGLKLGGKSMWAKFSFTLGSNALQDLIKVVNVWRDHSDTNRLDIKLTLGGEHFKFRYDSSMMPHVDGSRLPSKISMVHGSILLRERKIIPTQKHEKEWTESVRTYASELKRRVPAIAESWCGSFEIGGFDYHHVV